VKSVLVIFPFSSRLRINNDMLRHKQAKINNKNRRFGVFLCSNLHKLPWQWRHENTETLVFIVYFCSLMSSRLIYLFHKIFSSHWIYAYASQITYRTTIFPLNSVKIHVRTFSLVTLCQNPVAELQNSSLSLNLAPERRAEHTQAFTALRISFSVSPRATRLFLLHIFRSKITRFRQTNAKILTTVLANTSSDNQAFTIPQISNFTRTTKNYFPQNFRNIWKKQ